jgi:hypothetical protein
MCMLLNGARHIYPHEAVHVFIDQKIHADMHKQGNNLARREAQLQPRIMRYANRLTRYPNTPLNLNIVRLSLDWPRIY